MKFILYFTIAISIVLIIAIIAVCGINLCKRINWGKETKGALTKTLNIIITVCSTFVVTGSFTLLLQCESNQNIKNNEPLILENKPVFSNKGNVSKLKLRAKQGTVVKGLVVLFKGNNVLYSPIHFNGNKDLVSENFKISSKNKDILTESNNINISENTKTQVSEQKVIVSQKKLVQLGVILKDSKGNVMSYYYLIRPSSSAKKGSYWKVTVNDGNNNYKYNQYCNNQTKAQVLVNSPIIGTDSMDTDLSNIEGQIKSNKKQISNYEFHLVKSNDRTINVSNFKTDDGKKTLQDDAVPGKTATITSDPIITLQYNIPNQKEIRQNIEVLDNIIKDF